MNDKLDIHAINLPDEEKLSQWQKFKYKIRDAFPHVKTHDVDEYFAMPKSERQKWGIYLKPLALPCEMFERDENKKGWDYFDKKIREEYPIQGWFREWFLSIDNPVYWFINRNWRTMRDIKYNIKHFISPCHPRFRKAYPRHKWQDLSHAMVDINFAIIQDFYYEEIKRDIVNWESTEDHKAFREWIEKAIYWIEKARPQAEKDIQEEYTKISEEKRNRNKDLTYDDIYGKINAIEKQIDETDTIILKEMIEKRGFFWT